MQKAVFIAGFIGLLFGFLFSGTLGIDFFPEEENNDQIINESGLDLDEEGFRQAYNLTRSIYIPITGVNVYERLENDETFILYIGRDTCPYCQQYVPVLMEAAENLDFTEIYHVDSIDSLNAMFINTNNITGTPTTFVFKEGVLVEAIVGYRTLEDTEDLISNALS
jgi:predicted bacteriocin transport accessory protein